jgi:dipeptidyl aminopeptidase/acylaminoacyl peptidase
MIHGEDDDNQGTWPIQSQRLFAAIKGHGGTARLVLLPHEAHGYRGRETTLQCLAEMVQWLDRYVKNRPQPGAAPGAAPAAAQKRDGGR